MTTNIAMMTSIMPIRMIIIPAADPIMMYCWFRLLEVGASLPTVTVGESMSAWKKRGEDYYYSETSDKGHSLLRTQYKKPLILRTSFFAPNYNFPILLVYFQPLRRGHLPIKDKNCWSQGVLYIEVSLYKYYTIQARRFYITGVDLYTWNCKLHNHSM